MAFSPLGGEFVATDVSSGQVYAPTLAPAGASFVVSWTQIASGGKGGGASTLERSFYSDGTPLGASVTANAPNSIMPADSRVAALNNGKYVIVWQGLDPTAFPNVPLATVLRGRIFSPAGTPIGNEFDIVPEIDRMEQPPLLASLVGGGFVVMWSDDLGVRARLFDDNGAGTTGTLTVPVQNPQALGRLPDGGFVTVGIEFFYFGQPNVVTSNIQFAIYNADGTLRDPNVLIANPGENAVRGAARIAVQTNGDILLLWSEAPAINSPSDIHGRLFTATGVPKGDAFVVNEELDGNQNEVSVAALSDGSYVAVWIDENGDSSGAAVHGRYISAGGVVQGAEFQVNTTELFSQSTPTVASLGLGKFVVGWLDGPNNGMFYPYRAQIYSQPPVTGDQTIDGDGGNNNLIGNIGNDTISGNGGNDTIDGLSGVDRQYGGEGNDVIVWDPNDNLAEVQGGNGNDVLVVMGVSAPTSFDLAGHGFESAELRFTPSSGPYALSTLVTTYNTSWVVTQSARSHTTGDLAGWTETTFFDVSSNQSWVNYTEYRDNLSRLRFNDYSFDDGSRRRTFFDALSVSAESSSVQAYDAQGRLLSVTTNFDDLRSQKVTFDADGSKAWTQIIERFDATNALQSKVTINDNGTKENTYYDAAGQFYFSSYTDSYDTLGRVMTSLVLHDDGASHQVTYDNDSTKTWNYFTEFFDASQNLRSKITLNDDGTIGKVYYDINNQSYLSSYTDAYDTLGRRIFSTVQHDDGSSHRVTFDAANNQAFDFYTENFDATQALRSKVTVNDNGTTERTYYDVGNTSYFSSYTDAFDATSRRTSSTVLHDDGASHVVTFDADDSRAWSFQTENYDSSNVLRTRIRQNDNGTVEKTYYDAANASYFAYYTDLFDTQSRRLSSTVVHDDGASHVVVFDAANDQAFSYYTENYDTAQKLRSKLVMDDSGARHNTYYDADNLSYFVSYTDNFNAIGQKVTETSIYDNGQSHLRVFDPNNIALYSNYIEYYRADTTIFRRTTLFDNGTTTDQFF